MIVTSIEQSKHLLELGLKPETADMHWSIYGHNGGKVLDGEYQLCFNAGCYEPDNEETDIPSWTIDALLKLMPKAIDEGGPIYTFSLLPTWNKTWCAVYGTDDYDVAHDIEEDEPFDAVYKILLYVIENGYLKEDK